MRNSPLIIHHQKLGAELSGTNQPLSYGDVDEEYWTVRKSSGILDLSHVGRLSVTGGDRLSFLNGLLTNDIANLKENQGVRACLLTPKARVVADMYAYNLNDHVLLDTGDADASKIKNTLDHFVITEDVQIMDLTTETFLLSVQGPKSDETILRVLKLDVSGLKPLECRIVGPNEIVRHDRTGQGGYDIMTTRSEIEPLWQAFLLDGVTPVGLKALETLRIEAGIPKYGVDIDQETLVLEAGLKDAISFNKGCYMGQEVVARATFIGRVNRRLAQLVTESSKQLDMRTAKISDNGKEVGLITSSTYSPALTHTVSLGYVGRDYAKEGAKVDIVNGVERSTATVTKLI